MAELPPDDVKARWDFIRLLRQTRLAKELTQKDIGDALGTDRNNISNIEACIEGRDVYLGTLQRYARAVGCRVVLTLENDPTL